MAKTQKIIKRGEIYLVNFDPTVGSEINKTRPALVVQNDTANRHSPVTIVAAITSFADDDNKIYPTEVLINIPDGGLENDSLALLNQIRTIDKRRLIKKLGSLRGETMRQIDMALQVSLGLE